MSPVYDSLSTMHVLTEIPQGAAKETPCSVVARLARGRQGLEGIAEMARALAESHMAGCRPGQSEPSGAA